MLSLTSLPSQDVKVIARPHKVIDVGGSALDLSGLPQLVNTSQTRAIVSAMRVLAANLQTGSLAEVLQQLDAVLDREGLTTLIQHDQSDYLLARPRSLEIGMAINRLVSLTTLQPSNVLISHRTLSLDSGQFGYSTKIQSRWRCSDDKQEQYNACKCMIQMR